MTHLPPTTGLSCPQFTYLFTESYSFQAEPPTPTHIDAPTTVTTCSNLAPPSQARPTLPTSPPQKALLPTPFISHSPPLPGSLPWLSNQTQAPTPTQACPSPKHPCLSKHSSQDSARSQASFRLTRHGYSLLRDSHCLLFFPPLLFILPSSSSKHNCSGSQCVAKHHGRQGLTNGGSYPSPG